MALTYTPGGELGSKLPEFALPTVDGRKFDSRKDLQPGQPVVVAFICNHCPYVQAIEDRFVTLAHEYSDRVQFIGICSNDASEYPEDSAPELLQRWKDKKYAFPYLIDEDQTVARAFAAVCTPDLYVYDEHHKLSYRGRLDDAWRSPANVQRQELREALDSVLAGEIVSAEQNPSMGCSIKWKSPS